MVGHGQRYVKAQMGSSGGRPNGQYKAMRVTRISVRTVAWLDTAAFLFYGLISTWSSKTQFFQDLASEIQNQGHFWNLQIKTDPLVCIMQQNGAFSSGSPEVCLAVMDSFTYQDGDQSQDILDILRILVFRHKFKNNLKF